MTRLFVANYPLRTPHSEMLSLFSQFGTVEKVDLCSDKTTGAPRGYGFIDMSRQEEAAAAVKVLDGSVVGGRTIAVQPAKDKPRVKRSKQA